MNVSSSLAGIQAASKALGISASNVSNVNTDGYKARRALQSEGPGGAPTVNVDVFDSQGALIPSDSEIDLAILGKGHFALEDGNGDITYTRNGHFHIDGEGQVVDADGKRLIPEIKLPDNEHVSIRIEKDGTVNGVRDSGETIELGRLMLAPEEGAQRAEFQHPSEGDFGEIVSFATEASNTDLAEEMVNQIEVTAQTKANAAAVKTQDEVVGSIIDIVS